MAALKAVKESRALSSNQKVAFGLARVVDASRHGSSRAESVLLPLVCHVNPNVDVVSAYIRMFAFAPCRTVRSVGCAMKCLR